MYNSVEVLHPVNLDSEVNKGRRMIIYTLQSLEKCTYQISPSLQSEDACLLEIRLPGGDTLLFGCIYRRPTPSTDASANNKNLNDLLKTIPAKLYSHLLLVGDFIYKNKNWSSWSSNHGRVNKECDFIEAVRDCFLFQHIDKPSRIRGDDEPCLLDLLFNNEELQVCQT